jgi:hypothetical protein
MLERMDNISPTKSTKNEVIHGVKEEMNLLTGLVTSCTEIAF